MPAEVLTLIWVSLVLLGVALLALTLVYRAERRGLRRAVSLLLDDIGADPESYGLSDAPGGFKSLYRSQRG